MESTNKSKLVFWVIIAVILVALLAAIHYLPFWSVILNIVCVVAGWWMRIGYVKYKDKVTQITEKK